MLWEDYLVEIWRQKPPSIAQYLHLSKAEQDIENYLSLSKNEAPHLGLERQPFLNKEKLIQDQLLQPKLWNRSTEWTVNLTKAIYG